MQKDTARPDAQPSSDLPLIIQGGMGAGVSDWRLANAVARAGQLGVVSGTGINTIFIRRLQDGDSGGHTRRAMAAFPDAALIAKLLDQYFIEGGRKEKQPYRLSPVPNLQPSLHFQQLSAVSSFVEVYLAKENHDGVVGINLLEKLHLSNLCPLYGAMLAGVDYVLMGAGIPREIPGVLDRFSRQEAASIKVPVAGAKAGVEASVSFDPAIVFPAIAKTPLKRPLFLGIISSATLAMHLAKKSTGQVNGFVIEGPTAGGHNAPPRGPLKLDANGEPIYGEKDRPDLEAIRELGLPFWLAGSFGTGEKLVEALELGATGIQVGTAFAFCEESGMSSEIKSQAIRKWAIHSTSATEKIFTDPLASPTEFPFKVAPLAGTLSDQAVYLARPRKCDLGYLRQVAATEEGKIVYRCSSEPVADYLKKGGTEAATTSRKCLCNALMANIDLGQTQPSGYDEEPLVTAGDDIVHLSRYLKGESETYTAGDVIEELLSLQPEARRAARSERSTTALGLF